MGDLPSLRVEQRGHTLALICSCCDLPFARAQAGALLISSRHHGATHTNALSLEVVVRLLESQRCCDI